MLKPAENHLAICSGCLNYIFWKGKDLPNSVFDSPRQWGRHLDKVIMLKAEIKIDLFESVFISVLQIHLFPINQNPCTVSLVGRWQNPKSGCGAVERRSEDIE